MAGIQCKLWFITYEVQNLNWNHAIKYPRVKIIKIFGQNVNFRKMKEMTVHHLCCITCFGIAITTGQYLGLAMLVLNMEINSIFLHGRWVLNKTRLFLNIWNDFRSLLQYCQFRGTPYFAVAAFLNVLTNITHRQLIGMQVLKWFYQLTLTSEEKLVWVGFTSGIIIFALNVKLLITCIKSDYLRKRTENKFWNSICFVYLFALGNTCNIC